MIIYGLKGMAAYTHHALNISKEDLAISAFIYEALASTLIIHCCRQSCGINIKDRRVWRESDGAVR